MHQLSSLLFHLHVREWLVRELGSHYRGKWSYDPIGESVISTEVIANFMMKRSQRKATFKISHFTLIQRKIFKMEEDTFK